MITRRDVIVALVAIAATFCLAAAADQPTPVMGSAVFDWNTVPAKQTPVGSVRSFCKAPTATFDELEVHVTTLNPGLAPHPPHRHPNEELVIMKEGTVEVLVSGNE